MRKNLLLKMAIGLCFPAAFFTSCVNDDNFNATAPVAKQSFTEEFDTISSAYARGWKIKNTSEPMVPLLWQQGGDVIPFFQAYSTNGSNEGFIGINAIITAPAIGVLSSWLISPPVTFQNGDTISFYTRSKYEDEGNFGGTPGVLNDFGNRVQLRLNTNNDGLDVGSGTGNGSFTTPLLDINPAYNANLGANTPAQNANAFPANWTKYQAIVYGLNAPTTGRFALRYLIEDGTLNGSGIGIDKVEYKSVSN